MKKTIYTVLFSVFTATLAMAQAVLPTSYSWDNGTPYPTGWSAVDPTPSYYTSGSSAHTPPSLKMDYTGDKVIIHFASTPGTLTYWLTSNSFSGGTFVVEESADGTTWTVLHSFVSPPVPSAWTQYIDTPNSASRYIRFNYSLKDQGNIGLDDVSLSAGVSTAQEINVKQGTTTIVNGGMYSFNSPLSTPLPLTLTVENLGTVTALQVTGAVISGAAASDYTITSATSFTVAATNNTSLNIDFTPSATGTRNAVLTITNDDVNGNPYIINLNGIGGTLATEPTAQATNMTFPIVKSYLLKGQYTAASPAPDGYLVLRRTGVAITDVPVDGTVYQRGDMIGNSKVVCSTNSTSTTTFLPNDIVANTNYYFVVFSYNGVGAYRNYLTTSPLAGNVTSSGSMQPTSYYSSISTSASTLITDLHAITFPHSIQYYSSYGPLMVAAFYTRDTTANQRVVTCVYSGENKVYSEPFDWTTDNFSREHTYCQSWQPTTNDANFQDRPEYNDYHMITPTDQNNVNGLRSNNPLGVVVGTPTYTYLDCKIGDDSHGNKVFEPRDADKGDAARCMLYQCIAYTGVAYSGPANTNATYGGSWALPGYISSSIPYGQDQNVLKKWSEQDPPDNFEIARNDYVDSLQGNRNPFIDHPEYICYIDFVTMTKIAAPNVPCDAETLGLKDNQKDNGLISLAPNPNNGIFTLNYTAEKNQKINVKLVDMLGRVVYDNELLITSSNNPIEMNVQNLKKGIYFFEFVTEKGKQTEKLVIQ